MRHLLATAALLALTACGMDGAKDGGDNSTGQTTSASGQSYETYADDNHADTMASNDDAHTSSAGDGSGDESGSDGDTGGMEGETFPDGIPDSEERPIMQAQVVLDRVGFGPGVIDGKMGMSTENALLGFQEAENLEKTGKLDEATKKALSEWDKIPATRVVTVPQSWDRASYTDMPEEVSAKAKLDRMGYKSLDERLAERFHTTVAVLKGLNPNGKPAGSDTGEETSPEVQSNTESESSDSPGTSYFRVGQQIRVPNIGADRIAPGSIEDTSWQQTLASLGVGSEQPDVDRIVVSKAGKTLKAYQGEKLVALFTVSSGSSQFPLPLGEWDILAEAYNPPYSYDPEVLGQGDGETYELPPGPNSPVGVVWIDLSKEHYGIHGTPEPETIGRAQSSGCVRLTNWDAARLAGMVSQKTKVEFVA